MGRGHGCDPRRQAGLGTVVVDGRSLAAHAAPATSSTFVGTDVGLGVGLRWLHGCRSSSSSTWCSCSPSQVTRLLRRDPNLGWGPSSRIAAERPVVGVGGLRVAHQHARPRRRRRAHGDVRQRPPNGRPTTSPAGCRWLGRPPASGTTESLPPTRWRVRRGAEQRPGARECRRPRRPPWPRRSPQRWPGDRPQSDGDFSSTREAPLPS